MYANTHTDLSSTGSQVNYLREEARQIVHKTCGCTEEDEVIFCGSGSTAGINALTRILGIYVPKQIQTLVDIRSHIPKNKIPVVMIGTYEHHSNIVSLTVNQTTTPKYTYGNVHKQCN